MKKVNRLFLLCFLVFGIISSCQKEETTLPIGDMNSSLKKGKSNSSTINVPSDYASIQQAIENAVDGCVIFVGPGTYKEQIEIRDLNNVKIKGNHATITVPDGGMKGQFVKFYNCQNFQFSGFTIDGANGQGIGYGTGSGDKDTRLMGIFALNSSGKIFNNVIENISWHNGVQQGLGLYFYVEDGVSRDVEISDNIITNFQKGGIVTRTPGYSKIIGNEVTHWCETGIIAGNGIQIDGGRILLQGNTVSCSKYYDVNHQGWATAAILAISWVYPIDELMVVNNNISNSDVGLWVIDYGSGVDAVKIINNRYEGNIWDFEDLSDSDNIKIQANKFE